MSVDKQSNWTPVVEGLIIGPDDLFRDANGSDVPRFVVRELIPGPVPPGVNALEGWTVRRWVN